MGNYYEWLATPVSLNVRPYGRANVDIIVKRTLKKQHRAPDDARLKMESSSRASLSKGSRVYQQQSHGVALWHNKTL